MVAVKKFGSGTSVNPYLTQVSGNSGAKTPYGDAKAIHMKEVSVGLLGSNVQRLFGTRNQKKNSLL